MKKALSIFALFVFLIGVGAPAFAVNDIADQTITLTDEDPKKKDAKKSAECSDTKKSDCSDTKKSDCSDAKKTSDCKTTKSSCSDSKKSSCGSK